MVADERTRTESKEHPADVIIDNLPKIVRFKHRLSKLADVVRRSVRNNKAFIAYVDARAAYQSMRGNLALLSAAAVARDAAFAMGWLSDVLAASAR